MTSINAIRFNRYEGACICDESISSSGDMRLDVSDKIQSCVPAAVTQKYGIVAAVGSTGSCSVGAQIKSAFYNRVFQHYEAEIEKHGKAPEKFLALSDMGRIVFDVIVDMKRTALSDKFTGEYGFSVDEFLEGYYSRENKRYDIKDKNTIRKLSDLLTWKYQQDDVAFIFNNAALLAGYDDRSGVCIFHYDLRGGYWHKVQTCYLAEGSGRHSVDPAMYPFVENLLINSRRGEVDRVEGLMALIHSLNSAVDHEIGVGGYPNIMLIDGRQAEYHKRLREVNDERALLSSQILRAVERNYLEYKVASDLIDKLIYQMAPFAEIYDKFLAAASNVHALIRFLRGYKIRPHMEDILEGV